MIPPNTGRLIAIGDIHGCSNILRVILKDIDPQSDDTFVFLGDYVDRGPDSKGVIEEIMALAQKCNVCTILGNHEEMILAAFQGGKSDHDYWQKFGGVEALASYGVTQAKDMPLSHLKFIANCSYFEESDDFIFVHAWCDPEKNLDENNATVLRWSGIPQNPKKHKSGKTVICGHSNQKQVLDFGHAICIDTGCGCWVGGRLTAIDLKSGKIWQANGRSKKATIKQRGEPVVPLEIDWSKVKTAVDHAKKDCYSFMHSDGGCTIAKTASIALMYWYSRCLPKYPLPEPLPALQVFQVGPPHAAPYNRSFIPLVVSVIERNFGTSPDLPPDLFENEIYDDFDKSFPKGIGFDQVSLALADDPDIDGITSMRIVAYEAVCWSILQWLQEKGDISNLEQP